MPSPKDKERRKAAHASGGALWAVLPPYEESGGRVRAPGTSSALEPSDRALSARPGARPQRAPITQEAELNAASILQVGSLVGKRYVIEQHISSGGFGSVYRASDREISHHQVALKLLHRRSASDADRQASLRELQLLATVTHPSIVQFKDYGWHEGRLWFAMPWYRGKTLDRILAEDTPASGMSRAEARPLFTRLAHGLAAMHAMGIHHHDIKPENIFVAQIAGFPGGLPVLLDLGIATQRGENPVGLTVEYASPETAAAMLGDMSRPIGAAADVFSLALVLRNMLDPSLATPVDTADVMPLLTERAKEQAPVPRRRELRYMRPHFRRWLSLDPRERPTAAELAEELAILTAPEEHRQGQVRYVKRAAPWILACGCIIVALFFQVRRQKSALVEQSIELAQQRQVGEALRKKSAEQLEKLDLSAKKLGNERRLLRDALTIARKLNNQLSESSTRLDKLEAQHKTVSTERDALALEAQRLTAERDRLSDSEAKLSRERTELKAQRAKLDADLEKLTQERNELARRNDRIAAERDRAGVEINALGKRIDALFDERERLSRDLAAKEEKYQAEVRLHDKAKDEIKALERELSKAKDSPSPRSAEPRPRKSGSSKRSRKRSSPKRR